MSIRKRYELVVNGRSVLRLKPKQDKVVLDRPNIYGGWTDPETLDREHLLELRDVCDEILTSWFCPDKPRTLCPVCEREYGGLVQVDLNLEKNRLCPACSDVMDRSQAQEPYKMYVRPDSPLVLSPADVGRLDMGEPLVGRETGQAMQGEDEQQLNVTQTHDRPCTDYYCRTCYPDKKGITPPLRGLTSRTP